MSTLTNRLGPSLVVWGATTLLVAVCAASWWRKRRLTPPEHWRRVGELSEIYVYPLKSGGGIELQEAECTELGPKTGAPELRDRSFLVVTEKHSEYKTARQLPHMVLIKISAKDDTVIFEAPEMEPLIIHLSDIKNKKSKICTLGSQEKVMAVDCGDEAASWMSRYLLKQDSGFRLVYHTLPALLKRKAFAPPWLQFTKVFPMFRDQDMGVYSDMTSYMLMCESSVKVVAEKLPDRRITPRRFRPNFVVRGSKIFEEDSWSWVKIGEEVVLKTAAPCTRCVLPCIDPDTGIMDPEREPLKTLKSFRQLTDKKKRAVTGDSPVLGVYMGAYSFGKVSIGDPVYVA